MPIYLLTPKHLDALEWSRSTRRDPVQVEAITEMLARQTADSWYCVAMEVTPGKEILVPPWTRADLVSAKVVEKPDPALPFIRQNKRPPDRAK